MPRRAEVRSIPEHPRLTVTRDQGKEMLRRQIEEAEQVLASIATSSSPEDVYAPWAPIRDYAAELLRKIFTTRELEQEFAGVSFGLWEADPKRYVRNIQSEVTSRLQTLRSIDARLELFDEIPEVAKETPAGVKMTAQVRSRRSDVEKNRKDLFIVHGHGERGKIAVARFVERLGLNAIILHEQPDKGRTIIEKFLDHSDVGFAVALLTADDKGCAVDSPDLNPRARRRARGGTRKRNHASRPETRQHQGQTGRHVTGL